MRLLTGDVLKCSHAAVASGIESLDMHGLGSAIAAGPHGIDKGQPREGVPLGA